MMIVLVAVVLIVSVFDFHQVGERGLRVICNIASEDIAREEYISEESLFLVIGEIVRSLQKYSSNVEVIMGN